MENRMYAWKRLADGEIAQQLAAATAEDLFEASGFGTVDIDKPLKGYLAVRVEMIDGTYREVEPASPAPRPDGGSTGLR